MCECLLGKDFFVEAFKAKNGRHIDKNMWRLEMDMQDIRSLCILCHVIFDDFWCPKCVTLPETNIAPETLGLEDESPFGKAMLPGAMLVLGSAKSTTQVLLAPGFSHPATWQPTRNQPENLDDHPGHLILHLHLVENIGTTWNNALDQTQKNRKIYRIVSTPKVHKLSSNPNIRIL